VRDGVTGFIAHHDKAFIEGTVQLLCDSNLRLRMGAAAREQATAESWHSVFELVYEGYQIAIQAS
jgi:hypothetical protein